MYYVQPDNRPSRRSRVLSFPICTAGCTLAAILIWLMPGASELFEFNRTALATGETWRAVTGHLTHWNADHLLWDALMFAGLGALVERTSRRAFLATTMLSVAAISAVLWLCRPGLEFYRGLSGVDSALFVFQSGWLVCEALRERRSAAAILPAVALVGFAAKIGYELVTGATLFVDSAAAGFAPLPIAHVIGGAVGLLTLGLFALKRDAFARRLDVTDNHGLMHQPRRRFQRFLLDQRHTN